MSKKIKIIISTALLLSLFCVVVPLSACSKKTEGNIYDITCELKDNKIIGKENVTFYNKTDNSFKILKFNLYANAYRKDAKFSPIEEGYRQSAYYVGESFDIIDILSVKFLGNDLAFNIGGEDLNILYVDLNGEVFPNESVTVEINYQINLAYVISRTGINVSTINLACFYPILCGIKDGGFYECVYYNIGDPFYADTATYHVTFTYNSNYTVAHTGYMTSENQNDNTTTSVYSIENARSFCMVLSKKYKVITKDVNGVQISYYYYNNNNAEKYLQTAIDSITTFSNIFGAYPYSTYSVCQTEFLQGGMEFTSLVYINGELEEDAFKEVIVHESAHQWWGITVGNNEIETPFLDESLAEYSVIVFYENNRNYNMTRKEMVNIAEQVYRQFITINEKITSSKDTSMLRSLNEYLNEYEYVNIAYIKGALMMEYLRQTIGDEKFFMGFQQFYLEKKFGNATPYDLVGVYENIGAQTNGFFQTFFDGKEII